MSAKRKMGKTANRVRQDGIARLAQSAVVRCQAAYEVTENPVWAWYGLWCCLDRGISLPASVRDYFMGVATEVMNVSRNASIADDGKLDVIVTALDLRLKHFGQFDRTLQSLKAAENLESFIALGANLNQDRAVDYAVKAGTVTKKTAERRLAEANKIKKRAIKIATKMG
jgi:hypothetical protein